MVQMWQERLLNPPPVCTIQHELRDSGTETDLLRNTRFYLEKSVKPLTGSSAFSCELFLLRKLIYKNKSMFKTEKTMQAMKQLQRCMARYLEVEPTALMKPLLEDWPSALNLHYGSSVYLPSRQMLEYVLVRLIGGALLLHESINRSIIAHGAIMEQIKIGMQIPAMTVFSATISRIWVISRAMKRQILESYGMLHPVMNVLKPTQAKWLKDGAVLPVDLESIIGEELGVLPSVKKMSGDRTLGSTLAKWDSGEGGNLPTEEEDISGLNMSAYSLNNVSSTEKDPVKMFNEDIGETVQRDLFKTPSVKLMRDGTILKGNSITSTSRVLKELDDSLTKVNSSTLLTGDSMSDTRSGSLPHCSQGHWMQQIQLCSSTKKLVKLIKSFQDTYSLRSKLCRACIQMIKGTQEKQQTLVRQKKSVKNCLLKVMKVQERLGRLVVKKTLSKSDKEKPHSEEKALVLDVKRKKKNKVNNLGNNDRSGDLKSLGNNEMSIVSSNAVHAKRQKTHQKVKGKSRVGSSKGDLLSKKGNDGESRTPGLNDHSADFRTGLTLSLSEPRGLNLAHKQVKSDNILNVLSSSWRIPKDFVPHVKNALGKAKMRIKDLPIKERKGVIHQTVKKIVKLKKMSDTIGHGRKSEKEKNERGSQSAVAMTKKHSIMSGKGKKKRVGKNEEQLAGSKKTVGKNKKGRKTPSQNASELVPLKPQWRAKKRKADKLSNKREKRGAVRKTK